jgi:diguanylate cyclase (GGDEF)-like protein/PAS domain S-box-containing protein
MPACVPADTSGVSTPPASPAPQPGDSPPAASLRQILAGLHQGVVLRDANGTITDVNPAAEEILGRTRAELIGRQSVNDAGGLHMDGTSFPQGQSASSVALATGRDVIGELVGLRMPNGELRSISVNARALRDGDVITGIVSTFVDVTEQQQVVAALAESEKRFRLLAENAGDLITSIDPEGLRTYVSPSCRWLLGYEPEELIGQIAIEIVHPEDQPRIRDYFRLVFEQEPAKAEARFRHKSGRWIWMQTRGRAVRDAGGNVVELQTVARDITAERHAAEELREAEERFRNAFDQAPIGKALVSTDGHFTRVNAALCRITGYSEGDLLGTTFQALTHPDDLGADLDQLQRVLAGESESYEMEKRYRHADGHYIWALLSVSLVRGEAGVPLYFVSQIQDISEQKLDAERLTAMTLHDPLTGLANRVLFADRLAHAVERGRRSKERIAVLFIDFDRFKAVNDSLGHAAGDELLRQAAGRMRRAVRPADTIARLGGDEFTVLCEDLGRVDDASWVASRVSEELERPFLVFGTQRSIGVSIGIAVAASHDTAETVLAKADAAMYRSKDDRRDWQGAA